MADIITSVDLPDDLVERVSVSQLNLMLDGLNARAIRVAPCLGATGSDAPTSDQIADARLVLVSEMVRWIGDPTQGAGGTIQAGSFQTTTQPIQVSARGWKLWPSAIRELQDICKMGRVTSVSLNNDRGRRVCDDFDAGPPC